MGTGRALPATARASSVLVTIVDAVTLMDDMGSERPAKARASSVLEMAPMIGTATAVACNVITFPASSRASSLLVGKGFAWATLPPALESKSAAANERPSFENLRLVVSI